MLTKTKPAQSLHSKEDIRAQAEKMARDPSCFSAHILQRFLLFIVNETLEGRSHCLKEYTIATNVLNKPSGFRPQESSVVRIHAGRLRRAISQYYSRNGASDPIRISIPKGNYVPVFQDIHDQEQAWVDEELKTVGLSTFQSPKKIKISVLPLRYCANQKIANTLADGIGFQLTSGLQNLNTFSVVAFQMIKNLSEREPDLKALVSNIGAAYLLTGGVETIKGRVRISIELVETDSFEQLWSKHFDRRISESDIFDLQDDVIQAALENVRVTLNQEPASVHKVALMPVGRIMAR